MKKRKNIKLGVKQKILIPVIIVNIIVCASLGLVLGSRMSATIREMAAEQAVMAAQFAITKLDGDVLATIQRGDEDTQVYREIKDSLSQSVQQSGMMYAYTLTTDGDYVYYGVDDAGEEGIGMAFEESYEFLRPAFEGQIIQDTTIFHTEDGVLISCYVPIRDSSGKVVSILGCDYDASDIEARLRNNTILVILITVFGLGILLAVSVFNISKVLRPLKMATAIAAKIQQCDLSGQGRIECADDEIGELTRGFEAVSQSLSTIIKDVHVQLDTISQGDFTGESTCSEKYVGGYEDILNAIGNIRNELNESMQKVRVASGQIAEGAQQISDGAQSLSVGTSHQAATVEEVSGNMEDMSRQITETARRAQEAAKLSAEADSGIQNSNQYMAQFTDAMREIDEYSRQIQNIIHTIDDIAAQTNILALNAAVEAARSGAAGKGFAVVAEEVRNLAQKSAEAAKDTEKLIDATTRAIRNSDDMAMQVAEYLRHVAEKSALSKNQMQEISEISMKQAEGAEQISHAIGEIAQVIQNNSALSQQTAATCEELSAQTDSLRQMLNVLKLADN